MFKKFLCLILAIFMVIGLTACKAVDDETITDSIESSSNIDASGNSNSNSNSKNYELKT